MISESIDKLLRYRESSAKKTKTFRRLKHNKSLCPKFEKQMNVILSCYGKYQKIAYDVQGINDNGVDIVVRFNRSDGEKYIGFQIKSYDDLRKRTYLADLKRQYFDAKAYYSDNLLHYYIVVCTYVKEHLNKIRQIKSSFATHSDTTVIDPTYNLVFIKLSEMRINTILESYLKEGDQVYNDALQTINDSSPTEIALLFAIVLEKLFSSPETVLLRDIYSNDALRQLYETIPDFERDYYFINDYDFDDEDQPEFFDQKRTFRERVLEDIETLEGVFISFDEETETIEFLDIERFFSIEALLLEAHVRYGYDLRELLVYLYDVLEVKKRFELDDKL